MTCITVALWTILIGFALEEFVLIKPVSTMAASDPFSRRLEWAAIWLPAIAIGLTTATLRMFGGIRLGGVTNVAGFMLCVLGLCLRYWSRRTLGRYFTIGVVKQEGHVVIQDGPYRFVRHPAYLLFVLLYLGLPLLMGSWFDLLILSIPTSAVFVWLCVVEDNRLAGAMGDEYREYIRKRARLIPGVW